MQLELFAAVEQVAAAYQSETKVNVLNDKAIDLYVRGLQQHAANAPNAEQIYAWLASTYRRHCLSDSTRQVPAYSMWELANPFFVGDRTKVYAVDPDKLPEWASKALIRNELVVWVPDRTDYERDCHRIDYLAMETVGKQLRYTVEQLNAAVEAWDAQLQKKEAIAKMGSEGCTLIECPVQGTDHALGLARQMREAMSEEREPYATADPVVAAVWAAVATPNQSSSGSYHPRASEWERRFSSGTCTTVKDLLALFRNVFDSSFEHRPDPHMVFRAILGAERLAHKELKEFLATYYDGKRLVAKAMIRSKWLSRAKELAKTPDFMYLTKDHQEQALGIKADSGYFSDCLDTMNVNALCEFGAVLIPIKQIVSFNEFFNLRTNVSEVAELKRKLCL